MPKFDTTTIEGFDAMSDAEKVSALLGAEIPEAVDLSGYVKKSVFDAKASEAAELSKKLKSKMTDDEAAQEAREQAEKDNAQKYSDLENKYNELVKKSTIAEYKAKYIAQGMDESLAEDTAKALADGDMSKVFANQAKHQDELGKKIKAELMNQTPRPEGGNGGNEPDSAIEKARALGKAKNGGGKQYEAIMKNYRK